MSVESIRDQTKRGWELLIDAQPFDQAVTSVHLTSPYGTVSYGWNPDGGGFDTITFAEPGGGGQQILPFSIIPWGHNGGKLHVGVLEEWRHNQGKTVLNA